MTSCIGVSGQQLMVESKGMLHEQKHNTSLILVVSLMDLRNLFDVMVSVIDELGDILADSLSQFDTFLLN